MDDTKKTAFLIIAFLLLVVNVASGQDCTIKSKANDIKPDRLCAPVHVTWKIIYRGVNDGGTGDVSILVDWDDGNPAELIPAINDSLHEWSVITSHVYPIGGDKCNYHPNAYLVVAGVTCTSSFQPQIVTVWDTDDMNGGEMMIDPQVYPICYGNEGNVTFTDVSQWNCTPPDERDVPNSRKRWVQWIYGTGGTNIMDAEVNGVVESYPFAGAINETSEPILGPVDPYRTTLPIHIPVTDSKGDTLQVGDFFEVTLRNWNYCNPYDDPNKPGPPKDTINGDFRPRITTAIAIIVALPDGTIAAVGPFCENEAPVDLNAATPGGIWSGPGITDPSSGTFDPAVAGPGLHTINYDVTNADGCSATGTTTIEVWDAPKADITSGPAVYLCPGIDVTLDGNPSQGTLPYVHLWSGDTSPLSDVSVQDPNFNTTITGTYTLFYKVTDARSCYDIDTITMNVNPVDIHFDNPDMNLCTNVQDTLKPDPVGGSGVFVLHQWRGTRTDLLSATDVEEPTFLSPSEGLFKYEYYVEDNQGCGASDSLFVHVYNQPVANAGANDTVCGNFNALSAFPSNGTGTWSLITGDGSIAFSDVNDPQSNVTVDAYGTYLLQWEEENHGCSDADTVILVFYQIPVPMAASDGDTCGLEYDISVFPDIGTGKWSLKSGPGTVTFADANSSDTHVSASVTGDYVFEWTEASPSGCIGRDQLKVSFYPVPVASTAPFDPEGCNPVMIDFQNTSVNANTYSWDFGDGFISNQENPTHTFRNPLPEPDTFNVQMIAFNSYGCVDTMNKEMTVFPTPLSAMTVDKGPGCHPLTINFTNKSEGATMYNWDMGDGSPVLTDLNVTHTFKNTESFVKSFRVFLAVENNYHCKDTSDTYVTVYPKADFNITATPDTGCHPVMVDLISEAGAFSYNWDFGDGTSIPGANAISHIYQNTGSDPVTYNATLYTSSVFGCLDTAQTSIKVNPSPVSKFSFTPNIGCAPLEVAFTNESTSAKSSLWKFGDGMETALPDSGSTNHVYMNNEFSQKIFKPVLVVENIFGCVDSTEEFVSVYPQVTAAIGDADNGCSPHDVSIMNTSMGASEFYWDYGDGNTSNGYNGKNVYTINSDKDTTFTINMVARSVYGCTDTAFTSVDVYPSPESKFSSTPVEGCAPLNVKFTNESGNVTSSTWKYGNGQEITLPDDGSTSFLYKNTGFVPDIYRVSLIVENSYGCIDSTNRSVTVYPEVVASLSDGDNGCSPHQVAFANNSVNAFKFSWDYGDGNVSNEYSGFNTFVNNTTEDVSYNVVLTATSGYGCVDKDSTTVTVYRTPKPDFDALPIEQQMPESTVSISNNTPGSNWDYTWLWDDGHTSSGRDPDPHTYDMSGSYDIKLIVEGEHCADSTSRSVTILTTLPTIDYGPDAEGCPPLTVQFYNNSTEAHTYMWEFGDGSVSSEKAPEHTFSAPGEYKIKLTVYGPGGTVEAEDVTVTVYDKPYAFFEAVPNKIIIPGQSVSLLNRSTGAVSSFWDLGDGNTSNEFSFMYEYTEEGVYDISLEVANEKGCTDKYIMRQAVTAEKGGKIDFPNAFTPNPSGPSGGEYVFGDKENYVFYPFVQEGIEEYKLQIYTRWGELIFESNDIKIGWDGYYKGKLAPQGVYIYKANCKFGTGEMKVITGDVTLLR